MSNQILNNLKAVRELIGSAEHWTTGWYARDDSGKAVYWNDPTAAKFDLGGAIWKVEENEKVREEMVDYILNSQHERGRINSLCVLNDKLGHEQVIKMIDDITVVLDKELNPEQYKEDTSEAPVVEVVKKKRGRPRKNPI
jgi:hypothetical protein